MMSPSTALTSERPIILVVDDMPENLQLLVHLLEDDYILRVASSGGRALEMAHRIPHPDLILLDICMPGMDGYSVLSALKVDPGTTNIPVIFVSALSEDADEKRGLELGAADYITKPIKPELLRARIRMQLELLRYRLNPVMFDLKAEPRVGKRPMLMIVDDTPEHLHHLEALLTDEYHILTASSGEQALGLLEREAQQQPDLILLDVMMPSLDGYEVCRRIKASPDSHRVPVIFITAAAETQAKLRGFEFGASDYITRPFDPDEVKARVRTHLEFARLQRYLEALVAQRTALLQVSEDKYRTLVHRDPLTGLANRVLFSELLTHAITRSEADGVRLGLIVIDLFGFTNVNESLGYAMGDLILREAAKRLRQLLPGSDAIARCGGDSFQLFMELVPQKRGADLIAQQVIEALSQPMILEGQEICLSANVGIALYPDDGGSTEEVLSRADAALQQAKKQGRGALCFFSSDMSSRARERLTMEADLRRALKRGELCLHYQPVVDLISGQILSMEALLRWQHPERGLIAPMAFIPIAEESGLIEQVGEWVIQTSCMQFKKWSDMGLGFCSIAVNISTIQIDRGQRLYAVVTRALSDSGIPPSALELEITESALMQSPEQAQLRLSELADLGVKLSLDDFGTGYSSLAYLQGLHVHKLKIDMSFIRGMTRNTSNVAIVKSILALGQSFGLEVIAEGVEELNQAHYLRTLQCDQVQGFLVSDPIPPEQVPGFMAGFTAPWLNTTAQGESTLLLVDDEPSVISSLKRLLRRDNYRILSANSGEEALEILAANDVGVILSDQRMPGMTGTELLAKARTMHPNAIRMVLSGYTGLDSLTDAINEGEIFKFLFKPWDDDELRRTIRDAFRQHELSIRNAPHYQTDA